MQFEILLAESFIILLGNVSLYHREVTFFTLGNIFDLKSTQWDINIAIHLFLFVLSVYAFHPSTLYFCS